MFKGYLHQVQRMAQNVFQKSFLKSGTDGNDALDGQQHKVYVHWILKSCFPHKIIFLFYILLQGLESWKDFIKKCKNEIENFKKKERFKCFLWNTFQPLICLRPFHSIQNCVSSHQNSSVLFSLFIFIINLHKIMIEKYCYNGKVPKTSKKN